MPDSALLSSWRRRLSRLWATLVSVHPSVSDVGDQRRARLLMAFALLMAVMLLVGAAASIRSNGLKAANVILLIASVVNFLCYGLGRTSAYRWGAFLLPITFSVMGVGFVLIGTDDPDGALYSAIPLALILASALLPIAGQVFFLGVNLAAVILLIWVAPNVPQVMLDSGIFFTLGASLVVVTAFRNSLEKARLSEVQQANQELRAIQNTLEDRVVRRTQALEASRQEAESARQRAEEANRALGIQMWQIAGQSQLNEILRGDPDLASLANGVTSFMCRYLELPVGAFYLRRDRRLHLLGGFAMPPNLPAAFDLGEGLLGQAALEKRIAVVAQPAGDPLKVAIIATEIAPTHVIFVPLVLAENILGVIEMGAFEPFAERSVQFLERVAESIAVAVQSAQTRAHLNELLEEIQRQAEELQAQEEELRAANEELLARTESF
jgi:putative methionine-R-sulfoxide reductase with GAF domain